MKNFITSLIILIEFLILNAIIFLLINPYLIDKMKLSSSEALIVVLLCYGFTIFGIFFISIFKYISAKIK